MGHSTGICVLLSHLFCALPYVPGRSSLYKHPGHCCKGKAQYDTADRRHKEGHGSPFRLPDSLRMVRRVVVQGQCIREKSMVLTAVIQVQPLFTSKSLSCARLSNSKRLPCAI